MATAYDETLAPIRRERWRPVAELLQSDNVYRVGNGEDAGVGPDVPPQGPVPAQAQTDRELFKLKYEEWLDDSMLDSLPDAMRSHESYKSIVAMGQRVVPLIAAELRRRPGFIFLALEDITGDDPVDEMSMGNLGATTDAWLKWLRT